MMVSTLLVLTLVVVRASFLPHPLDLGAAVFFPEAASDKERKHDQERIHDWEVDQVRSDRVAGLACRVQGPDPFPEEQHRQTIAP